MDTEILNQMIAENIDKREGKVNVLNGSNEPMNTKDFTSDSRFTIIRNSNLIDTAEECLINIEMDFAAEFIIKYYIDIVDFAYELSDTICYNLSEFKKGSLVRFIEAYTYRNVKRFIRDIDEAKDLYGMIDYSSIHYNTLAISSFIMDVVALLCFNYHNVNIAKKRTRNSFCPMFA